MSDDVKALLIEAWSRDPDEDKYGCVAKLKYRTFDTPKFVQLLESLKTVPPASDSMDAEIVKYLWMIPLVMLNSIKDVCDFIESDEIHAQQVLVQIRQEAYRILGYPYA